MLHHDPLKRGRARSYPATVATRLTVCWITPSLASAHASAVLDTTRVSGINRQSVISPLSQPHIAEHSWNPIDPQICMSLSYPVARISKISFEVFDSGHERTIVHFQVNDPCCLQCLCRSYLHGIRHQTINMHQNGGRCRIDDELYKPSVS